MPGCKADGHPNRNAAFRNTSIRNTSVRKAAVKSATIRKTAVRLADSPRYFHCIDHITKSPLSNRPPICYP